MEPELESHWMAPPPRRNARGRLSRLGCVVLVAAVPWAVAVSFVALKLWAAAASDCEVFGAGNRFAVLFLYWPVFAAALWVVFAMSVLLLSRRSLVLGVALGATLTVAIAYWFVSGTAGMILDAGGGQVCPSGLPDWWPSWATR